MLFFPLSPKKGTDEFAGLSTFSFRWMLFLNVIWMPGQCRKIFKMCTRYVYVLMSCSNTYIWYRLGCSNHSHFNHLICCHHEIINRIHNVFACKRSVSVTSNNFYETYNFIFFCVLSNYWQLKLNASINLFYDQFIRYKGLEPYHMNWINSLNFKFSPPSNDCWMCISMSSSFSPSTEEGELVTRFPVEEKIVLSEQRLVWSKLHSIYLHFDAFVFDLCAFKSQTDEWLLQTEYQVNNNL